MATIIEYQSWECYDTDDEEQAIAEFRKQYKDAEIIGVVH